MGSRAFFAQVGREMVAATFWFDPDADRISGPLVIRFVGHRKGVGARPRAGDQFVQDERVDGVEPGSGPVSVTTRVRGVSPGEWIVSAKVLSADASARSARGGSGSRAPTLHAGGWSWRTWSFRKAESPSQEIKTCLEPFALTPGVVPGVWALLALVGFVVAIAVQQTVLARVGLPAGTSLNISLAAIAAGLVGAQVKYSFEHRAERLFGGWAVQGFLAATAVAGTVGLAFAGIDIGAFVDASVSGIFLGLAIGRLGCFLAGCCGGRPTSSRWGVWSSDRRVGMRRVPTQLLEAGLSLGIALVALIAVLAGAAPGGGIFVASLAVYTLLRQGIRRLRDERPASARGSVLTAAAAAVVLLTALAYIALSHV